MKNVLTTGLFVVALTCGAYGAEDTKVVLTDAVDFSGDLRLRHEMIDQDGKSSRHRQRLRARLSAKFDVNEDVKGELRAASGEDDPTSTNQSFDDAFTSKGLQLDLAYLTWVVSDGITLVGGKMKKPWVQVSPVVWDGDLNPEGFAAMLKKPGDGATLMANAGYFTIDELSGSTDDLVLYTGQAAIETAIADGVKLLVGGSVYLYENFEGATVVLDSTDSFGNDATVSDPATSDLVYDNDFSIYEGFAQVSLKAGDVPVKIYGHYAVNDDAADEDTGFAAGFKAGKAKERGQMEFGYMYEELEANAVLGAFTDSDFAGGGANTEGHKISGKVVVSDHWTAGATLYLNAIDPDGADTDYSRLQLDLVAKF
jgi:hypothetical protein